MEPAREAAGSLYNPPLRELRVRGDFAELHLAFGAPGALEDRRPTPTISGFMQESFSTLGRPERLATAGQARPSLPMPHPASTAYGSLPKESGRPLAGNNQNE